ncbi:hypothetical protein M9H77_18248 [Catharanthus roseus]|uniref:Uncharacterized protein n=1 Tax=Catharanthus roseus TaxID=4058 RepID=A0ACC0B6X4_CATRO|nr:hypothetical protein M9H77_18248 [Catharanthus roseus]
MHNRWEITIFVKEHTCLVQIEQNKHINLSSKFISMSILHLVANDPEIPVSNIIQEVQVVFQTGCTYKRAWYTRKFAIERVFGSWDTTFTILPKYLQVVQDINPGTVYKFLHHRTSSPPNYVFKFVFWCFSPCIDGFPYCRPMISVDGAHLRGPYKGVLLIASTWDANNHLFPLAFAIVDKESSESWNWLEQKQNNGNLILDAEKWTLLHDGGHRHGIMTTNISEALNGVLKKARVLPLKAMVELIFNKLVKYFHQHCEEAENCVHSFPTRIFDKFLWIKLKSREHKVTTYNPREEIYMIRSPIRVSVCRENGKKQILMCRRYICDKRTEELTKRIFIRS